MFDDVSNTFGPHASFRRLNYQSQQTKTMEGLIVANFIDFNLLSISCLFV